MEAPWLTAGADLLAEEQQAAAKAAAKKAKKLRQKQNKQQAQQAADPDVSLESNKTPRGPQDHSASTAVTPVQTSAQREANHTSGVPTQSVDNLCQAFAALEHNRPGSGDRANAPLQQTADQAAADEKMQPNRQHVPDVNAAMNDASFLQDLFSCPITKVRSMLATSTCHHSAQSALAPTATCVTKRHDQSRCLCHACACPSMLHSWPVPGVLSCHLH